MITISQLTSYSKSAARDLAILASALHETKTTANKAEKDLQLLLRNNSAVLMVAKDRGVIVGMAMLFALQKIGRKTATIEDVVVLESYRGHGLGEKLMRALMAKGKKMGLRSLTLTSRPERVAANKLYQKLGFTLKKTNVYTRAY